MGCSIHIITEIRKNGKWEYVSEVPEDFNKRDYSLFGFLADTKNYFATEGFKPKGLPEDISSKKFKFESSTENLKKCYRENTQRKVKLPDGSYISPYDERLERKVDSKEEAEKYPSRACRNGVYYLDDVSVVNGEYVEVPYTELMTEEEYLRDSNEWNEDAKDYGYWKVDFENGDYFSESYLTLKELQEKDLTNYCSHKCKIPKDFYDKFLEYGGKMPKEFIVKEEREPGDFIDAIRYSIEPDVIISWEATKEEMEETTVVIGIKQLKEIAKKYNVEAEDIRIVFAFDN